MIRIATENTDGRVHEAFFRGRQEPTAEMIVQNRFQRSPYLSLRRIRCLLDEGTLVLRGRVPTFYIKQLAQTIAGSLPSVHRIINELTVDFPDQQDA